MSAWTFPPSAYSTDSKTIYLLGHAESSASVNGTGIELAANGNFAHLHKLELGENKITLDIDGVLETRIVTAVASKHSYPIAYAQPYAAWIDAQSSTRNILRSIIVDADGIRIPFAAEPKYRLYRHCEEPLATKQSIAGERSDEIIHILEIQDCDYDLDWVYYKSDADNIIIQEDNIVIQGSKILIPIKFEGELLSGFNNGFLELKLVAVEIGLGQGVCERGAGVDLSVNEDAERANNAEISQLRPLLCIDAGHGGSQLGAVSPRGVYEKDLNLQLALKLKQELEKLGKQIIMTRETDIDVSLQDRVQIATKADLFISLHHNALPDAGDPKLERGISLHYYQQASRPMARALLASLLAATGLPAHGLYRQNLHVLRESKNPIAFLLELGFMIHPEESEIIVNESYQDLVASTMAKFIA